VVIENSAKGLLDLVQYQRPITSLHRKPKRCDGPCASTCNWDNHPVKTKSRVSRSGIAPHPRVL